MDIGWKLASTGAAAAAALIAGKAATVGWKLITGNDAPSDDDDDVQLIQLLAFSAASAIVVSLAQRFTMRGAKRIYAKRGHSAAATEA